MADGGQNQQTPPARPYHALKAIPDIDAKILAGIAQGRSLQSLATEYGVEDMAILNRCQRDFPDAYKAAAKIGYELRMDKREKELECADTNVGVTRADRLLNHARWLAERSCPERWGQKTETHHSGGLTVEIVKFSGTTLDGAAQRVVEPFSSAGGAFASDAQAIDNAGQALAQNSHYVK